MSVQATFSATLADEWVRCGVTDAVICPGSRSTPLALALAERLTTHVRLDERSGAFFALGLAMASGRPVVICVTSGTAGAELHPAVVEAHHAHVPLLVCTADRPPELLDTGAPQTIEQVGLFGSATRWSVNPGVPSEDQASVWRPLARRAFAEALTGPRGPGPVHLNLAFREPLVGAPGPLPGRREPSAGSDDGRQRPLPVVGHTGPSEAEPLSGRGLLIVGGHALAAPDRDLVSALGERLRWPVLADPRSGCRVPGSIAAADAIVRTAVPLPQTVVLLGDRWLSKALAEYVARAADEGARVIAVDPWWRWTDPSRSVTEFHHVDTNAWLAAALESVSTPTPTQPPDASWLDRWRSMEKAAQGALVDRLGDALNEPQVARAVQAHAAASGATVVVSASMPIRDLEWYASVHDEPPRVLANRGANGIDGVVSTALGVAASNGGRTNTIALLGDLAFLHDVSGLVNMPRVPCVFVVVDNHGGGIFSFLPQAQAVERGAFEQLFGTPPTTTVASVARGFGLDVREVTTLDELEIALSGSGSGHVPGQEGPTLVHVHVPGRTENVALHESLNQAVAAALG